MMVRPQWLAAALLLLSAPAFAQFPVAQAATAGEPPADEKAEKPADEKAEKPADEKTPAAETPGAQPDNQGEGPALQPLAAYPAAREKSLQLFQLNGYIRFRAYLFHNFNLGINQSATGGPQPPFPVPYSEIGSTGQANPPAGATNPPASCAARDRSNCRTDNLTSADMRLRLEPTINVSEQVRVKAQFDVFDNMVLGSTNEGYYLNGAPVAAANQLSLASHSQEAPESGLNSVYSSIRAKRAWAEVRTPFGELRFGRMPSHWGMGMLVNNGDCLDCDFGVNADRVMFSTKLYGHFIAAIWDWAATGPTTQIIGPQQGQGIFYNADTIDDVSQWILAAGKKEDETTIRERVDRGELVLNYGGYFVYRQQDWSESSNPPSSNNNTPSSLQALLVPRHARVFVPDLWLRLNWRKLHIEAEGAMVVGSVGNLSDQTTLGSPKGNTKILSGGFTMRADYKLLHDALKIMFEVGYASGGPTEDPNAVVNYHNAAVPPFAGAFHNFYFDPDYHVDYILFRRLLGTVYNATYFKPSVSYDIVDTFGAQVGVIYSLANNPIGFPGNSYNLGLEIDASILYKNEEEGFYAGVTYGVLFPFGALALPASIYGANFAKDSPDAAQTLQARLIVKF